MTERLIETAKRINRAKTISLYCHTNPDGDTLGSALALYFALAGKGKTVDVYCDTAISSKYRRLTGSEIIVFPDKRVHDLAIAVDCSDLGRLGDAMKSYLCAKSQIAIDHHKSHEKFADFSLLDSNASATAEIVYKLLKQLKALDDKSAKLLFGAIVSDSGCFSYSNTTPETHRIACELLEYSFDAPQVIYDTYKRTTVNRFNLKNRVLSKCRFFEDSSIALIVFSSEDFKATDTDASDTEGIISEALDIDSVKVAFAVSEMGNKNYKLSIRTKDNIDASDCARVFGGGGHKNAAGCRVNGYLEDIVDKLLKIAKDRM